MSTYSFLFSGFSYEKTEKRPKTITLNVPDVLAVLWAGPSFIPSPVTLMNPPLSRRVSIFFCPLGRTKPGPEGEERPRCACADQELVNDCVSVALPDREIVGISAGIRMFGTDVRRDKLTGETGFTGAADAIRNSPFDAT